MNNVEIVKQNQQGGGWLGGGHTLDIVTGSNLEKIKITNDCFGPSVKTVVRFLYDFLLEWRHRIMSDNEALVFCCSISSLV